MAITAAIFLLVARAQAADDRYVAWLSDGSRLTAKSLPQWPVPGTPNRFGDRDLLSASNSVRLVRDRQAQVTLAAPYLVMANGDVLRGTPAQLDAGHEHPGQPPRLAVQLEAPLLPVTGTTVSVRTDRVRRIVLSDAPAQEPPPGTVVLADGRRLTARSIRWREFGLAILTHEGIVEVSFGDLAEVVFPHVEVTAAVQDDNLWAGGAAGAAIARLQMTNGTVVTASRISREQEQSRRRGRVTSAVYYYVQPAWADEPIALPEEEIAAIGYRAADEAPLSLLPSQSLVNRRLLGHATPWTANRSGNSEQLSIGSRESDLGIATHAESAIAFDLPTAAMALELGVGFDASAGRGGCVRCKVVAERETGKVLWDSGVFEGKDGLKATGALDVAGISRIVLVTEFAHADRPPGADPFDIRDSVVWLAPLVKLNPAGDGAGSRALAMLPGAAEWELAGDGWRSVQLGSRWNLPASSWDPLVTLSLGGDLKLTRKLHVTSTNDVVELLTACPVELEDHDFELTVNGTIVPWHNNADRGQLRQWVLRYGRTRAQQGDEAATTADRLAYWWDLQAWRGQDVTLALALRGRRERSEIAWRNLAVRSAIGNLPDSGEPPKPAVPLLSLKPQNDAARSGRSLPLADAIPHTREGEPIRFLGQKFAGGYGMGRNSRISFSLAPDYDKFVAAVGSCFQTAGPLRVLIDGRVVWERPVLSSLAPAELIEIPLPAGAKTLTLESSAEGSHYGFAAFANAGFVVGQVSRLP
jgi:NPCBM/NEW2 domain